MTSEITALKLELATLHSALLELQQQTGSRPRRAAAVVPPVRPSVVPAAVVVLMASGLLSWQVITNPRHARPAVAAEAQPRVIAPVATGQAAVDDPAPASPAVTATPTVYRGTLTVRADHPGATVFVNRKNVGKAPVRVRNLRAGSHLVWVESDGYRRWSRVVTVPAEQVTRVTADLEPITENH